MSLTGIVTKRKLGTIININSKSIGKVRINVHKELFFNPDTQDVSEHVSCLASQIGYYGILQSELEAELENVKTQYELWNASVYTKEVAVVGKAAVSTIDKLIMTKHQKEYEVFQDEINTLKYNISIIKMLVEALKEKGMMLNLSVRLSNAEYRNIQ